MLSLVVSLHWLEAVTKPDPHVPGFLSQCLFVRFQQHLVGVLLQIPSHFQEAGVQLWVPGYCEAGLLFGLLGWADRHAFQQPLFLFLDHLLGLVGLQACCHSWDQAQVVPEVRLRVARYHLSLLPPALRFWR